MDFIRLALERTATADEALDLIIALLEEYGQGGNSTCFGKFFYHNSFLIADPSQAWILETAGKFWAAEKVQDIRTISNIISIGDHWDRASSDLVTHAISQGWCKSEETFNFSDCYSDLIFSKFGVGKYRACRTGELLHAERGKIDVPYAMKVLRDHGSEVDENWQPGRGILGAEVCMHASFGPVRGSQATGAMVSHLTPDQHTHWLTGTSATCTSVFKPTWIDAGLPALGPAPNEIYNTATLWWRHENLHREILRDYATRIKLIEVERDGLEADFLTRVEEVNAESQEVRAALTQTCFDKVEAVETKWLTKVINEPIKNRRPLLDRIAWRGFDRQVKRHPVSE
jgi:dipeptidase